MDGPRRHGTLNQLSKPHWVDRRLTNDGQRLLGYVTPAAKEVLYTHALTAIGERHFRSFVDTFMSSLLI